MPLPCTARKRKRQNRFRERMWFERGPGTRTCKSASRADFPRGYGSPRCPLPPREPSWGALGTRWGLLGLLQGTGGTCGGSARKPAKGPLGHREDESGARSKEEKPWEGGSGWRFCLRPYRSLPQPRSSRRPWCCVEMRWSSQNTRGVTRGSAGLSRCLAAWERASGRKMRKRSSQQQGGLVSLCSAPIPCLSPSPNPCCHPGAIAGW